MEKELENISIENAKIIFRNFKGEGSKYNRPGAKNFCVVVDSEVANDLKQKGWNIRTLTARDETEEDVYYLQVAVNFDNFPPKVFLISGKNKTLLDADTINVLDYAEIRKVDLIIRPYCWEIPGKDEIKCGVKAYLKVMYVTIYEDEFSAKYSNFEDSDDVPFQ